MSENLAEKDSKTQIQEYTQAKGLELPIYELESVSGDAHQPMYHVVCKINGSGQVGRGSAQSRQEAEQIAASLVLSAL
jgi:ribonuclease-3